MDHRIWRIAVKIVFSMHFTPFLQKIVGGYLFRCPPTSIWEKRLFPAHHLLPWFTGNSHLYIKNTWLKKHEITPNNLIKNKICQGSPIIHLWTSPQSAINCRYNVHEWKVSNLGQFEIGENIHMKRFDNGDFYYEEPDEPENEFLTPREVMNLLYIGRSTFYKLVNSGDLKAFRVGKLWRVSRADLDQFSHKPWCRADGQMDGKKVYFRIISTIHLYFSKNIRPFAHLPKGFSFFLHWCKMIARWYPC